jgi:hypothetical protein
MELNPLSIKDERTKLGKKRPQKISLSESMIAWQTLIIRVKPIQVIPPNPRFRSRDRDNLIRKKTNKITKPIFLKKEKINVE